MMFRGKRRTRWSHWENKWVTRVESEVQLATERLSSDPPKAAPDPTSKGPKPQYPWGHSGGPDPGRTRALSVCGRTVAGKGAAWPHGDTPWTGHVFLLGPDQYQRARGSCLVGPMKVSQKHCIVMVEGTSDHSLAKKYNGLLKRDMAGQF